MGAYHRNIQLADQVAEVVDNEQKVADKALNIAKKEKNKQIKRK